MSLAPWRSPLARNLHLHRSQPSARYLQLATVTPDGFPANRTIVFRDFLQDTDTLKFITDKRSQKVLHIQHQPYGEICWYFEKTREQFRIFGKLLLVTADWDHGFYQQQRHLVWQEISDSARSQFTWADPRTPRGTDFPSYDPDPQVPLPNFCLLLLEPIRCDRLALKGDPQNRWLYEKSAQGWTEIAVYP
ncbi:MAG: Npun_F5749 family FMN-dependent PPOX-type flavoprotein [Pseudanabaenaceae cyanobacterium]